MAANGSKTPEDRARELKDLINEGVALQVELLDAAVKIWSTIFESMAVYTRTASEQVLGISARGDANAALDTVIATSRDRLNKLMALPGEIGAGFEGKVRARAKR